MVNSQQAKVERSKANAETLRRAETNLRNSSCDAKKLGIDTTESREMNGIS
jgi:hypothetical protein